MASKKRGAVDVLSGSAKAVKLNAVSLNSTPFTPQDFAAIDTAVSFLYSHANKLIIPTSDDLLKCRDLLHISLYPKLTSTEVVAKIQGLVTTIAKLYPELTAPKLFAKLAGIDNNFFFLRTFVPYYYLNVADIVMNATGGDYSVIAKLKDFRGWCAGDAHLENFGTSLNADKDAVFSINDFDDAGSTLLVADALRLFTAAKLGLSGVASDSDLKDIVKSYKDGLSFTDKISKYSYSKTVRDLLKESEDAGWNVKKKAVNDPDNPTALAVIPPTNPADPNSGSVPVDRNGPVWKQLGSTLQLEYGSKVVLLDAIREPRDQGGSGGLVRYLTLVEDPSFKKILAIEFKQEPKPGVYPLVEALHGDVGNFAGRLKNTLQFEVSSGASKYYRAVTVSYLNDGVPSDYLLRPRFQSNRGLALKDIKDGDKVRVAQDEAFTLGLMHRGSVDKNSTGYAAAATAIKPSEWLTAASAFADFMSAGFNDIGKQL